MKTSTLRTWINYNLTLPNSKSLTEYGKGYRDGVRTIKKLLLAFLERDEKTDEPSEQDIEDHVASLQEKEMK